MDPLSTELEEIVVKARRSEINDNALKAILCSMGFLDLKTILSSSWWDSEDLLSTEDLRELRDTLEAKIAAINLVLEQRTHSVPTPASAIPEQNSESISATSESSKQKGKFFTVTSIVAVLGIVTAAIYFGLQYELAAEANELTLRESCRSHPNNTFLQGLETCQVARLEGDIEITRRSIVPSLFDSPTFWLAGNRADLSFPKSESAALA